MSAAGASEVASFHCRNYISRLKVNLKQLISEIKYLPNLVYLNLTGNYLVNLPFEITSCSALRTLVSAKFHIIVV
jgi:Leucine-rich repeat (LRR) protein